MAYVRLRIKFSDIAYQISAVLLLPINSAINPLLFTSLPDELINFCRQKYHEISALSNTSNVWQPGLNNDDSKTQNIPL